MKTKGMKKKQTFVKSLLFAMLIGAPLAASAQDVEINETNFPDENFRNWLLGQSYGADGIITGEEIEGITKIDVSFKEISSLKGIEHFTALTWLECGSNQLTMLDVTKNTALIYLNCGRNLLTTLNMSKNTELISLNCYINQLTELDVSGCTALVGLGCDNNQLTALDLSNNRALTGVDCQNNQIKGASMDALIASLPENITNILCRLYIYDSMGDDGNVCTKAQVAAAKAKGWTSYYGNEKGVWVVYEGCDDTPTAIAQPATATTDVNEPPVYTLSGRKVNNGSLKGKKGVYIIGGKKVVVK